MSGLRRTEMSSLNDPVWVEEHEGYWDDDLPRSFPEEEEDDADPTE